MPLIKLFRVYDKYINYDDYEKVIVQGISDWEEVTDDELLILKTYKYKVKGFDDVVIVEKLPEGTPVELIKSIKELIATEEKKRQLAKTKEEKRKEELKKQREAKAIENAEKLLKAAGKL